MNILQSKTYKNYDYISRYSSFPYYYNTIDKKYIYGTTSQLNKNISYILHQIKMGESIDSIALYYYNNPTYFWVICDFNNIQDPYIKLTPGNNLKIPSLGSIKFEEV